MTKEINVRHDLDYLRTLTPARIGLARAGSSIATQEILDFDTAHALARDAVHIPFDTGGIERQLYARGLRVVHVHSAAEERSIYLQRPDLGRRLSEQSRAELICSRANDTGEVDLAIVIADGLSTSAIHANSVMFLDQFLPRVYDHGWSCAPAVVASQGRVALADEIGEILKARMSIILIGERPGLSSADSMGIYVTYSPQTGRTDAERNCISNIRRGGLTCKKAARELESLVLSSLKLKLSGVPLKEQSKALDR